MKLDRSRPYGTILGGGPVRYVQDGIEYDSNGYPMQPFDVEAADREELIKQAEEMKLPIDKRWGLQRLKDAFRRI